MFSLSALSNKSIFEKYNEEEPLEYKELFLPSNQKESTNYPTALTQSVNNSVDPQQIDQHIQQQKQVEEAALFHNQQLLIQYQQQLMSIYSHHQQMFQPSEMQYNPGNFANPMKKLPPKIQEPRKNLMNLPRTLISNHQTSTLYEATYSNIDVYELVVGDNSVMRRKNTSWVNGTHILKVAGVEKGKRTKILEREVHHEAHEKIQGGYGKYQGTWMPLERAKKLASDYGVLDVLMPILELPE